MEYLPLGRTDLLVSRLALGCMGFADPAQGVDPWALDEQAAAPTLLENRRTYAGGRVRSWVGLEHLLYCSAEDFKAAAALAEEFVRGAESRRPSRRRQTSNGRAAGAGECGS
jgi:hypothetical protein